MTISLIVNIVFNNMEECSLPATFFHLLQKLLLTVTHRSRSLISGHYKHLGYLHVCRS